MTALIRTVSGHGARQCDAKCYGAAGSDCHCICGGMNHAKGEAAAIKGTRELAGDLLRAIEARGGIVSEEIRQGRLGL